MEALQHMRAQALPSGEQSAAQWDNGNGYVSGKGESSQMQPQVLFGYALASNTRGHEMGDFHVAEIREIGEEGQEVGLFAIFDSHGGSEVGRELQYRLFDNILGEGGVWRDPAGAIRDGYLLTDRQLLESSSVSSKGGSTAVTAMIVEHGSRLIVANVGDSKAVLCKNGAAVQLSVDHDPGRPTERAEVESRGGIVLTLPGTVLVSLPFLYLKSRFLV
jgi:protein phosphatase 1L